MANRWGNNENGDRFYFLGLQNNCRWWLQPWNENTPAPGKTTYDKPRQCIPLRTKVCVVKAMVFPVVMYGCESWTTKNAEHRRIDASKLWCWRRLLRAPWTSKEIKSVNPKWNQPWIFIGRIDAQDEAPTLWPPDTKSQLIGKKLWCWEILRAGEGYSRGWDGWMLSLTQWTWAWANAGWW